MSRKLLEWEEICRAETSPCILIALVLHIIVGWWPPELAASPVSAISSWTSGKCIYLWGSAQLPKEATWLFDVLLN